jgi:hypothetical protein
MASAQRSPSRSAVVSTLLERPLMSPRSSQVPVLFRVVDTNRFEASSEVSLTDTARSGDPSPL